MAIPVILCIGSTQVMGDSLGPKVGDLLRTKYNTPAYVYGGSKHPVNGVNYYDYYRFLKKKHPLSLIIAVDACVGNKEDVGKIKYSLDGLKAGEALSKNLPKVGDIGVLGVVCERQCDNLKALMCCSYPFIANMSEKIAYNISRFIAIPPKKNIL